jgi:hypothetical protein
VAAPTAAGLRAARELAARIAAEAALTSDERKIIRNTGLTVEKYLEHRAKLKEGR